MGVKKSNNLKELKGDNAGYSKPATYVSERSGKREPYPTGSTVSMNRLSGEDGEKWDI